MALPRRALVYLWLVIVTGSAATVMAWVARGGEAVWDPGTGEMVGLLFLLGLAAVTFPLHVAPGRKVTLSAAVYFAALLLLDLPLALTLIVASRLLAGVLGSLTNAGGVVTSRAWAACELAFNTGQLIIAYSLGWGVHAVLAPRGADATLDRIESLWAVPAAAVTVYLANTFLVAGMVSLQKEKSLLAAWLPGRREDAVQFVALYATGLLAALMASHYVWALLVMVLPAGMTYVSLKRTVELAKQSQVQLEMLRELSAQREELAKQMAEAAALHELDRTKNELITTISHELRTPITVIHGYAQMLKARQGVIEPKKMVALAQAVYVNSTQLQRLVQDLVDVGRVERGTFTLESEQFDVSTAVRDVVVGLQAREGGERVTYQSDERLTIVADRTRVVQVAANLVENALKYAPHGPIHVRVWRTGAVVRVEVEDSGPGVPAEEQGRVWEKFYRGAEVVRHNLQRGTGIGLALVKALVEAQGGRVGLEDAVTGGALFWFELPANGAEETGVMGTSEAALRVA